MANLNKPSIRNIVIGDGRPWPGILPYTGGEAIVGNADGLQLSENPAGPLALNSPHGDLGGMVLPRGMAIDHTGTLWFIRYSEKKKTLVRLCIDPDSLHSRFQEVRLRATPDIITAGYRGLFIADKKACELHLFALPGLQPRKTWRLASPPEDIAVSRNCVWILNRPDEGVVSVCMLRSLNRPLQRLTLPHNLEDIENERPRLVADTSGRFYLLGKESNKPVLRVYLSGGSRTQDEQQKPITYHSSLEAQDHFDEPIVRVASEDGKSFYWLELDRLLYPNCVDEHTARPKYLGWNKGGELRHPEQIPDSPIAPLHKEGIWLSEPLDSRIYQCQWDRAILDFAPLRAGQEIRIRSFASDKELGQSDIRSLPENAWEQGYRFTGTHVRSEEFQSRKPDCLLGKSRGQYLWLRIDLTGDGYSSPLLKSVNINFPRRSYLEYLPATFAEDEESRDFLERFLAVFQTEWDGLEQQIENISTRFNPETVPDKVSLMFLASWLGFDLEPDWSLQDNRILFKRYVSLLSTPWKDHEPGQSRLGTVEGVRQLIRCYLSRIANRPESELRQYPVIIEGFRERQHIILNMNGTRLWSTSITNRFHLDGRTRLGSGQLITKGNPELDVFRQYAHRFRVIIPAQWVSTAADRDRLQRVVNDIKPAHTHGEIKYVRGSWRLGSQSTLGLDTILGRPVEWRLSGTDERDSHDESATGARLGQDTFLGEGEQPGVGLRLSKDTQLGRGTTLG